MNDARTAILARVGAATRAGQVPDLSAPPPAPRARCSEGQRVERFLRELASLGVEAHVEASAADVCRRVAGIVARKRVLSWNRERLPYEIGSVLPEAVLGAGPRDQQAACEIGVTGCDGAIAETGTIAVLSAPGKSRSVSLLPPVHLAVVRPDDLCDTMGEFFETHADALAASASCTFITGPSRTADIELTLTLGVHGPGKVIVVLGPKNAG